MGEKKYFKLSTEDIEKKIAEKPAPEIKYLDETKTIAGYVCKKAEYTEKSDDGTSSTATVYYTEELGGEALNYGGQFNKLKGVPLEYVITAGGVITTFAATEVKKGKVKDTDFLIPSDYVEMSAEEKAQMMKQFEGEE
jgi:GLPGLI family protein